MKKSKRGQVALYIIIALAILAVILAVFLSPKLKPRANEDISANPQSYIESCLKGVVIDELKAMAEHGGDVEPEAFILHNGKKIKYLCYTSEDYKTCVVQEPLIKERLEEKLNLALKEDAENCVDLLAQSLKDKGFQVSKGNTQLDIGINPDGISVIVNSPLTISKETSRNYRNFEFKIPSKYYEVLYIASSILNYEATFGDSETTEYLLYYPEISIEKTLLGDGTTIYKVENYVSKESFSFASRSIPWPAGGF